MSADRHGSRHERYRERLAALASDAAPVEAIVEVGRRSGLWAVDRQWVRSYGRFSPDHEPYVALVFETIEEPQLLCCVDVFAMRPAVSDPEASVVHHEQGWIRVAAFPCDDALPTLPATLAHPGRRTVVRYRPGSRCTIRFEAPDGRVRFAKVFRDAAGERSHANGNLLWQAAHRDELDFAVARPEAWDPISNALWQEGIPGVPLTARELGVAGESLAHRLGHAAGSLTRSRVRPHVAYDWMAHFARSMRYAADVSERVPRLAGTVATLLQELESAHASVEVRDRRPIHGSLSRTQWIVGANRLGLVDFDKLAFGDPEFDVAAFLTELDYDHLQSEQIRVAFLSGYEAIAGPLDRRLVQLYAAQERLEKAVKSVRAVRPDGDARAELHLDSALAECSGQTTW